MSSVDHATTGPRLDRLAPTESRVAVLSLGLMVAAMAIDHLVGDDPGLEDPPMFLIAVAASAALAAFLYSRVVPATRRAADPAGRAARDGLICSVLALVPGITTLWLGLPFVLGGCGLAMGLQAHRQGQRGFRPSAAIAIGALVLIGGIVAYAVQAVDKLG